jgi:hypothetical protein
MKQGRLAECRRIVEGLLGHPIATGAEVPAVLAHQMLAAVCHGLGELGPALGHAHQAVRLGAGLPAGPAVRVGALRALIGVLADSGLLEDAWGQCGVLGALLVGEPAGRLRGEAEWVIGNVAFMRGDCGEGLRHHGCAAELLSMVGDIGLWAQFNKVSATVRLAAGITGAGTLEAIRRAEAAFALVRAGRRDRLELAFVRALALPQRPGPGGGRPARGDRCREGHPRPPHRRRHRAPARPGTQASGPRRGGRRSLRGSPKAPRAGRAAGADERGSGRVPHLVPHAGGTSLRPARRATPADSRGSRPRPPAQSARRSSRLTAARSGSMEWSDGGRDDDGSL